MKVFALFTLLLTAVSGFVVPSAVVAPTRSVARSSTSAMNMGLKEDFQKAAVTASAAVLTAAPAFATEGTGEPLGVEEAKALVVPLFVLVSINLLFNNWEKDQVSTSSVCIQGVISMYPKLASIYHELAPVRVRLDSCTYQVLTCTIFDALDAVEVVSELHTFASTRVGVY